jgi:ribonuclease BN (tRNA processing enzyme)
MTADHAPTIQLTVLGSGTCVPSLTRSACALLMSVGASHLLFDIGPGSMRRLLEAGLCVQALSHVCISHFHPDHTGELAPLIFANKYPDAARRRKPLTLIGGPGFQDFMKRLEGVYGHWIQLETGLLEVVEAFPEKRFSYTAEGWRLETLPVRHNPESVAYRLSVDGGPAVVYSGDTDYSENLVELARDADLLICEAARPDEHPVAGHLTPSMAGRMATEAGARQLMLTHFYPDCEGVDLSAQCRRTYTGPVILAQDLMRLEVN